MYLAPDDNECRLKVPFVVYTPGVLVVTFLCFTVLLLVKLRVTVSSWTTARGEVQKNSAQVVFTATTVQESIYLGPNAM